MTESGLALLGPSCPSGRLPGQEGTQRAQSGFVCPRLRPLVSSSCTEVPHSSGWLLCSVRGGLTRVFCWALWLLQVMTCSFPRLPCGRGSASPAPRPGKPRGFSLTLRSAFQVPLAMYSECAQNGEVFNEVPLGGVDLYR